jgi:hypothetical protein
MREHALELLRLEKTRAHVVYAQQRNKRAVQRLPCLHRETLDPFQDRQLAVDLVVRDAGDRAARSGTCRIVPFFRTMLYAFRLLGRGLTRRHIRAYVGGRDPAQATAGEVRLGTLERMDA